MTDSIVSTLRAMARNYAGGHSWDHLDGEAVSQAADEIERLRKASEAEFHSVETLNDANQKLSAQLAELRKGLESQVVEGLRADKKWLRDELDKALLQLREQDALLDEAYQHDIGTLLKRKIRVNRAALSASAEPSAPVEIDERTRFSIWAQANGIDASVVIMYPTSPMKFARFADSKAQEAWTAWQARAALARKP